MPFLHQIIKAIEKLAPTHLQESYDNAGLLTGNAQMEITGAILCIDITEEIIDEAIANQANLIISHHPLVFSAIKKFTPKSYVERTLLKAIKNDIAIYTAHTNLDAVLGGVNTHIANLIGLKEQYFLQTSSANLVKLVTYVPHAHLQAVQHAIFEAGAGHIGNYDSCSFTVQGTGNFRALDGANPFVGELNKIQYEPESRIETVLPAARQNAVIDALKKAHPYEEVAYDIFPMLNQSSTSGMGVVGVLPEPEDEILFLTRIKKLFKAGAIRHTKLLGKKIQKVALCGGAGSSLLPLAIKAGAQVFISGDFKYHQFFDADNQIVIADPGHFESEQFTTQIFLAIIQENFPNFAVQITEYNTNPIKYL